MAYTLDRSPWPTAQEFDDMADGDEALLVVEVYFPIGEIFLQILTFCSDQRYSVRIRALIACPLPSFTLTRTSRSEKKHTRQSSNVPPFLYSSLNRLSLLF